MLRLPARLRLRIFAASPRREVSLPETDARRVASIIHAALTLGVIAFAVVAGVLHEASPTPYVSEGLPALRLVAIGLAAGGFAAVNLLRQRVSVPPAGSGAAEWQATMGRAVVVWAVAEATALTGTVLWLVTRDALVLLPLLVGLVLLAWFRPSVLLAP